MAGMAGIKTMAPMCISHVPRLFTGPIDSKGLSQEILPPFANWKPLPIEIDGLPMGMFMVYLLKMVIFYGKNVFSWFSIV